MTGVLCVIQARMGSSRLPGKVLADLAGRPMLRFMLDRLRTLQVDDLVVATSTFEKDDAIADVVRDSGHARLVRGPEDDVLERFHLAVASSAMPVTTVIRLTADCPLVDPALVEAVLARHHERDADYTSNVHPRTFPKGLDVEVVAADAFAVAVDEATDPAEREHVTPFLYRRPERFRLASVRTDDLLGDERWTVDTVEDLDRVRRIVDRMGTNVFGWRDVLAVMGVECTPPRLHLRLARSGDSSALLEWRNDPETVTNSISQHRVPVEEHERWLAGKLDDPGSRLWVVELDGHSIGSIRLDIRAAVGEVSIALAPEARGKGLGTRVLLTLQERLDGDLQVGALVARVRVGNERSRLAFLRAGFVEDEGGEPHLHVLRWVPSDGVIQEEWSWPAP